MSVSTEYIQDEELVQARTSKLRKLKAQGGGNVEKKEQTWQL